MGVWKYRSNAMVESMGVWKYGVWKFGSECLPLLSYFNILLTFSFPYFHTSTLPYLTIPLV